MTLQNGTEALSDDHLVGAADAIEVARTVPLPVDQVWSRILSEDGFENLLGKGARLGSKGEDWRAEDGTYGVTRSFHPHEQVRMSWHAAEDAPKTMVDLRLAPQGDGTALTLRHEGLTDDMNRDELQSRWEQALDRLAS